MNAFQKDGFWIARQGKHITMTDGRRIITIPRANSIDAFTMGGMIRFVGMIQRQKQQQVLAQMAGEKKIIPNVFPAVFAELAG